MNGGDRCLSSARSGLASGSTPEHWKLPSFYVSVFEDARISSISPIPGGPAEGGSLVEFELDGQAFLAIDGGPMFTFTPAVSWIVTCDTQQEIDYFWQRLSEGGSQGKCGWLEDRFGISWQVVPSMLTGLMEREPEAVMEAVLGMGKIDLAELSRVAGVGT